jgi:peptidoglycan/LPS O-acetylase OafA/YrhL
MILTRSKYHAIVVGLVACLLGCLAIYSGDHHVELPYKILVALGAALVLAGLVLLRYSWAIRERR